MKVTDAFAEAMNYLAAGYQNFKPDPRDWAVTVQRYHDDLGGYSPMVFQAAVKRCVRAHPGWFPNVGQLRELCEAEIRPLREKQRWAPPERQLPTEATNRFESVEEIRRRFWDKWKGEHGESMEEKSRNYVEKMKARGAESPPESPETNSKAPTIDAGVGRVAN